MVCEACSVREASIPLWVDTYERGAGDEVFVVPKKLWYCRGCFTGLRANAVFTEMGVNGV
jgi:hypothetical protein